VISCDNMRTFLSHFKRALLVRRELYRLIFVLTLVSYSVISSATVYYVSNSGNDSNSGTSESRAWKSLDKVNRYRPLPGDQILFKRGDFWEGTLVPSSSGTSGNPIIYGAYGTGEKPKIYSSKRITGWTKHTGSIYKASITVETKQLFVNNKRSMLARYPNNGYFKISAVHGSTKFTSAELDGKINYKGASWIGRTTAFTLFSKTITASSSQTLTIDSPPFDGGIGVGEGFFLADKLEFLDSPGEWFYDESNGTVYLWLPNGESPDNHSIRGSIEDYGVNLSSKNHIIINGLNVMHSSVYGIYINNCDYITLEENSVISADLVGINLPTANSSNVIINNNYVYQANCNGIRCYSPSALITNNTVEATGLLENINKSTFANKDNFGTGIYSRSDNPVIEYNRVINSGYCGINWRGRNGSIKYNYINGACQVLDDGGGIYTYNGYNYSLVASAGSVVKNNIVLNVYGNPEGYTKGYYLGYGIYMDNAIHHVTIEDNLVSGATCAVFFNPCGFITLRNNTIMNSTLMLHIHDEFDNSTITNNIFYATDRKGHFKWWGTQGHQRFIFQESGASAIYDNNRYFAPYETNDVFVNMKSFADWQSVTKQDKNSTFNGTPFSQDQVEELFFNDTKETKSLNLGSTIYTDIFGNAVTGTLILEPFTSKILVKKTGTEKSNSTPQIQNQTFQLQGSQQKNDYVGKVLANDSDQGQSLNYSILQGNGQSLFAINPNTGEIIIDSPITATENVTFNLVVEVTDNSVYPLSASAVISINVKQDENISIIDQSAPSISTFTIPESSTTLTVPILSFNATDNISVNGYLIKESSATPSIEDIGWNSSKPSSYMVSGEGTKSIYAWVKDAAGNISQSSFAIITINTGTSTIPGLVEEFITICEGEEYFGHTKSGEYNRVINSNANENLFTNPDFSGNINDWRTWSANNDYEINLSLNNEGYISAPASMSIYCSANASKTTNLHLISNSNFEIVEGKEYELSFYIKATTEFQIGRLIILKSSTPWTNYGTFSNQSPVVTKEWQRVKVKFTATHTASDAMFRFYLGNSLPQGESMFVDDFYFGEFDSSPINNTIVTHLTVNPITFSTEDITILEGDIYNGWTKSGQYERILKSVTGCDSIVTTNLQVVAEKSGETPNKITQIGTNQMYFGITAAFNDAVPLRSGDRIEVYDGDKNIGSVILTESIDSTRTNTFANIIVNQDNGNDVGFTEGNKVNFKIWDSYNEEMINITHVTYKNNLSSWNTSGTFIGGSYSFIMIGDHVENQNNIQSEPQLEIQSINLNKGWNMFSTYLTPVELSMDNILKVLRENGSLIKVVDEEENEYKFDSSSQKWINNIGNLNVSEGYKIKLNSDCILEITGLPIELPLDIELKLGWNIISIPFNASVNAMEFLQPLTDAGVLEKVQDEKGNAIEYWDSFGWIDGIKSFVPGKGYKVLLNNTGYLPINSEYLKSAISVAEPLKVSHFEVSFTGNGLDHMNINFRELKETALQTGDEIAAFDGNLCVGAIKLTKDHIQNDAVCLNASFSGESIENGFLEGNMIQLKIWYASSNNEFNQEISISNGDQVYKRLGSVFVDAIKRNATSTNMIDFDSSKIKMFPNPANDLVNVEFSEFPANGTKIKLRDNTGRQITVREVQSSQEVLGIHSLPNGMYVVEIISGQHRIVNKLIKK